MKYSWIREKKEIIGLEASPAGQVVSGSHFDNSRKFIFKNCVCAYCSWTISKVHPTSRKVVSEKL